MISRRVLVVDDNKPAADSVVKLLQLMGYEAKSAYNGNAALQMIDDYRPEVVFVDLVMPDMDGIELGRRLLARNPELRTIALSAFGGGELQHATRAAGFTAHLVKPATARVLTQVLA